MEKRHFQQSFDQNYRCGFVTHVQSATLLIGAIGSLAGAGVLASLLKVGADTDQCLVTGMVLCSYVLLVFGWSARAPSLYWPFLILNPLCVCFCAVFCAWPSLLFLLTPFVLPPEVRATAPHLSAKQQLLVHLTRHLRAMEFLCSVGAVLLLLYFESVVLRAYNWQRKKNKLDNQLVIIGEPNSP